MMTITTTIILGLMMMMVMSLMPLTCISKLIAAEANTLIFFLCMLSATSDGTASSVDQTAGGHCKTHNMKLKFHICMNSTGKYREKN